MESLLYQTWQYSSLKLIKTRAKVRIQVGKHKIEVITINEPYIIDDKHSL